MNLSIDYASFAFQNIDIIDGFSILLNGVDDFFIDAEMLLVVRRVSIYVRQIDDAFGFEIFFVADDNEHAPGPRQSDIDSLISKDKSWIRPFRLFRIANSAKDDDVTLVALEIIDGGDNEAFAIAPKGIRFDPFHKFLDTPSLIAIGADNADAQFIVIGPWVFC